MRYGSALAFIAGLVLLGVVVAESDLAAVAHLLSGLHWSAAALVMAVFTVAWGAEILAWALTFSGRAVSGVWFVRLWLVNMVGEALNVVMPFGSLGGEPVKAWLLKRHYAIGYREATVTLVLMQTLLALAEAVFAMVGALLVVRLGILPHALEVLLIGAAGALAAAMLVVMIGLRRRWLRTIIASLAGRASGARVQRLRDALIEVEHALVDFAHNAPLRFSASTLLFLLNWAGGAIEIWIIMPLIGAPLPFAHCWVAESAVVMIRSLTFFVPGQLGSVEAITVLVIGAIAGPAELGFTLSLIRRARELAWSAAGLAVGLWYNRRWHIAPST